MTALQGRRVVLVGGAGFIGHNLALALAGHGAEVSLVDSLGVNNLLAFNSADNETPTRDLSLHMLGQRLDLLRRAGVRLFTLDAREAEPLGRLIADLQPQIIVHLAGVSHADRSNHVPRMSFEHTLMTLDNTLDAARSTVEHVIFFSSSMVYGNFPEGSVTEQTPCRPLGVYAAHKLSGENMVIAHQQVFDIPYTIIRPSALYGERCVSRRVGQVFIENALAGKELVITGDGTDRLDFTYIRDLVDGLVRVVTRPEARNQIFNLTFGRSRSINDLLEVLRGEFPDIRVRTRPKGRLVPTRGTLCVDKARALLDYEPRFPLEIGITRYVAWYRSLPDGLVAGRDAAPIEVTIPGELPSQV